MKNLVLLSWPASQLGEAVAAIARQSGLAVLPVEGVNPPEEMISADAESIGKWIEAAAAWSGIEAEAVQAEYTDVERFVRNAGPALLGLPGEGKPRMLALLGGKGQSVSILAPDLRVCSVRPEAVCAALCGQVEAPVAAEVDRILAEVGVSGRRKTRVRAALLRERLGRQPIGAGWFLRLRPSASFLKQASQSRLPHILAAVVGAHALHLCLIILAWWILGTGVLGGRLDRGWLIAWALLLLMAVPTRLLATWLQGRFTIGAGCLLKQRLLYGALRLEPEEIWHQGTAQILSRIIESTTIESLALHGGYLGLIACIELGLAGAILGAGVGGGLHVLLLVGWTAMALLVGRWFFGRRGLWTETRLELTNDLIERMVGHRTRLAQESRERWHEGEDRMAERYLEQSRSMDRAAMVRAGVARGWLVLGLLGLAPTFISGSGSSASLAVSLGGVLMAFMAFERLGASLSSLLGAVIAWRQIGPLFHAAARPEESQSPVPGLGQRQCSDGETLIEAHDLTFRYDARTQPALSGVSLHIRAGDRILLQGASGGGKSTLASLLTRLRAPESGLLLVGGMDRQTLGSEGWRRHVVSAPQFHENHVLAGTFAVNLLMGRRWPPREEDLREAEAVCRELGLGDLLDRMPAGMQQMVGEMGWQLSHGERSRLFLARALLQDVDMVILDESFAALDPKTLKQCLRSVMRRTSTLLVIAHP